VHGRVCLLEKGVWEPANVTHMQHHETTGGSNCLSPALSTPHEKQVKI